jgi:hypothetical protein
LFRTAKVQRWEPAISGKISPDAGANAAAICETLQICPVGGLGEQAVHARNEPLLVAHSPCAAPCGGLYGSCSKVIDGI